MRVEPPALAGAGLAAACGAAAAAAGLAAALGAPAAASTSPLVMRPSLPDPATLAGSTPDSASSFCAAGPGCEPGQSDLGGRGAGLRGDLVERIQHGEAPVRHIAVHAAAADAFSLVVFVSVFAGEEARGEAVKGQ